MISRNSIDKAVTQSIFQCLEVAFILDSRITFYAGTPGGDIIVREQQIMGTRLSRDIFFAERTGRKQCELVSSRNM